jgi:hypothetical protein
MISVQHPYHRSPRFCLKMVNMRDQIRVTPYLVSWYHRNRRSEECESRRRSQRVCLRCGIATTGDIFGWSRETVYLNSFAYNDTRPEATLITVLYGSSESLRSLKRLVGEPLGGPGPEGAKGKSARYGIQILTCFRLRCWFGRLNMTNKELYKRG